MKKASAVIGLFSGVLITLSTLFKIQHYPGASIMMIIGLITFSALFLPLFFIARIIEEDKTVGKIANIFALFSLTVLFIGILFKIQHYPGGSMMTVVGAVSFIFPTSLLLLVNAFLNKKSTNDFLKGVVFVAFAAVWVIIFGSSKFSGATVQKMLLIDEELTTLSYEMESIVNDKFSAIVSLGLTSEEKESLALLHKKALEVNSFINQLEVGIINQTGGIDPKVSSDGHWNLRGVRDVSASNAYLFSDNRVQKLKHLLEDYEAKLTQLKAIIAKRSGFTMNHFSIVNSFKYGYRKQHNWETAHFDNSPAFITLPTLMAMKSRVVRSELEVLHVFETLKIQEMNRM